MELDEMNEQAQRLQNHADELSRSLIPYYNRRKELRNAIGQTHAGSWRDADFVVTNLRLENRENRAMIFPELDRLNQIHAEPVEELRLIRRQLRGLQGRIEQLQKLVDRQRQ